VAGSNTGEEWELIADGPGHAIMQRYEEASLEPDQVRLRSVFSAVKHGTELRGYRADTADASARWDWDLRLHVRGEEEQGRFPMRLGNICLGVVTEIGQQVSDLSVGDKVFAHLPVRATHVVSADSVEVAPEGVSPQALMYSDPAQVAVGGVRDAPVRLGDRVAVFGLGAIGQMAVQVARIAGASWVAAIDPIEIRRDAASRHGADLVIDPTQEDTGLLIKQSTGSLGVDVSLETSGSYAALNDALRATKYRGTVMSSSFYTSSVQGLALAGEWHRNRIHLISSRSISEPQPEYGWDFERVVSEAWALLVGGRLHADDLIAPIVPLSRAAEAYQDMNEHPERGIKLGIDHSMEE
jgi:threonine dehydrogenase-like Zn-dependent dehydrogenase